MKRLLLSGAAVLAVMSFLSSMTLEAGLPSAAHVLALIAVVGPPLALATGTTSVLLRALAGLTGHTLRFIRSTLRNLR